MSLILLPNQGDGAFVGHRAAKSRRGFHYVHVHAGGLRHAFKLTVPAVGGLGCLKNELAPTVVNAQGKCCCGGPVGHAKTIILRIAVWCKGAGNEGQHPAVFKQAQWLQ